MWRLRNESHWYEIRLNVDPIWQYWFDQFLRLLVSTAEFYYRFTKRWSTFYYALQFPVVCHCSLGRFIIRNRALQVRVHWMPLLWLFRCLICKAEVAFGRDSVYEDSYQSVLTVDLQANRITCRDVQVPLGTTIAQANRCFVAHRVKCLVAERWNLPGEAISVSIITGERLRFDVDAKGFKLHKVLIHSTL